MGEFTELAPAASFPVVLFDGEREMEFGSILVHPYLGFRRFQTIISQKIGISLNQISTSLVRRKKARSSPDIPRKVPINEYSDFTAISRERNCFILVTLKRPPVRIRSRRRPGSVYAGKSDQKMAPEKMILKRNYSIDGSGIGGFPFDGDGVPPAAGRLGFWDYDGDLLLLQACSRLISRLVDRWFAMFAVAVGRKAYDPLVFIGAFTMPLPSASVHLWGPYSGR